jgi:ABC-type lipoprotein export system ATPase subunit
VHFRKMMAVGGRRRRLTIETKSANDVACHGVLISELSRMHPIAVADPLVELQGVSRRFQRGGTSVAALLGVSLAVAPGEFLAVVGPSGCGKSTLLNLMAGVDRADEGSVRVGGLELTSASEAELTRLRRRSLGIVFQAFHLVPNLTAAENVALPLALDGRSDPARVRELLARVGLEQRSRHYPGELSGGEQQRVAVARALVHRPALLVADEPTGNLDSASGARVLALLDELRASEGSALVLATHDARIEARAERTVHLRDGRIVEGP